MGRDQEKDLWYLWNTVGPPGSDVVAVTHQEYADSSVSIQLIRVIVQTGEHHLLYDRGLRAVIINPVRSTTTITFEGTDNNPSYATFKHFKSPILCSFRKSRQSK